MLRTNTGLPFFLGWEGVRENVGGRGKDDGVVKAIVHGLTRDYAKMQPPGLDFLPALIPLLESDDAYVQLHAAEVLGNWGPQDEATPALIQLLESDDDYVRLRAASVLGNWGSGHGAAEKVLSQLIEKRRPAVAYIERSGQGISEQPDPEAARRLAEAIKPQEGDTPYVQGLREVVFRWVWQASQRGD